MDCSPFCWTVDAALAPIYPRLFSAATSDGYAHWTQNGQSYTSMSTTWSTAPVWTEMPGVPYQVGLLVPPSVPGGAQHGMFTEAENFDGANWCVTVEVDGVGDIIGCYSTSSFSGAFKNTALDYQGGEVTDGTSDFTDTPMGSGTIPTAGYPAGGGRPRLAALVLLRERSVRLVPEASPRPHDAHVTSHVPPMGRRISGCDTARALDPAGFARSYGARPLLRVALSSLAR